MERFRGSDTWSREIKVDLPFPFLVSRSQSLLTNIHWSGCYGVSALVVVYEGIRYICRVIIVVYIPQIFKFTECNCNTIVEYQEHFVQTRTKQSFTNLDLKCDNNGGFKIGIIPLGVSLFVLRRKMRKIRSWWKNESYSERGMKFIPFKTSNFPKFSFQNQ